MMYLYNVLPFIAKVVCWDSGLHIEFGSIYERFGDRYVTLKYCDRFYNQSYYKVRWPRQFDSFITEVDCVQFGTNLIKSAIETISHEYGVPRREVTADYIRLPSIEESLDPLLGIEDTA